jgi:hypothetical protein
VISRILRMTNMSIEKNAGPRFVLMMTLLKTGMEIPARHGILIQDHQVVVVMIPALSSLLLCAVLVEEEIVKEAFI